MLVTRHLSALMDASRRRLSKAEEARIRRLSGEPDRGGNAQTRRQRYEQILAEVRDPKVAAETLERIINGNDLTDVAYLSRGAACARSVGRIEIRSDDNQVLGYGTGFLVAPGVVMTNNHVINDQSLVRRSIIWFDYEKDADGREKQPVEFAMTGEAEVITQADLDFTLLRLAPRDKTGSVAAGAYRWIKLSGTPGKTLENEYLTIIQHPAAQLKQVCVRENRLLEYKDDLLRYQTDTLGGSSGSPVFNQSWQVVGLHHSGVPKMRGNKYVLTDGTLYNPDTDAPVDESRIKWIANEGIRVSAILKRLKDSFAGRALADTVLNAPLPPKGGAIESASGGDDDLGTTGGIRTSHVNGRMRIVVPVEIAIGIAGDRGGGDGGLGGSPGLASPIPAGPADSPGRDYGVYPTGSEALKITSLKVKRNGFDPGFLGGDPGLIVPLPKPSAGLAAEFTIGSVKTNELKYFNYSVMLHAKRRLALYSAGHVDFASKRSQSGDATWKKDDRAGKSQIGAEFYKQQKTFESTRAGNPFDQGHLHMQAHATWGATKEEADKFGADTFLYPNCAPQFFQYNQGLPDKKEPGDKGTKLWRGLEDFIAERFASAQSKRCAIITGPIFDAPGSKRVNGQPKVGLAGGKSPDPTFGGFKIPKMFYKIVCTVKSGSLAASAFVISQEDYLDKVTRLKPGANERFAADFSEALTQSQASLYRVSIPDLERVTGLDFGLEGRSIPWFESTRASEARIGSWDDLK